MRPYRAQTVLLLCMMVFGVGLDLIPPQLTRTMVDRVLVPKTNVEWLPWILLGLVVTSCGRYALNIFIGRTSSLIGTRITKELRERLQRKLLEAERGLLRPPLGRQPDEPRALRRGLLPGLRRPGGAGVPAQPDAGARHRRDAVLHELAAGAAGAAADPARGDRHDVLLEAHLPALLPGLGQPVEDGAAAHRACCRASAWSRPSARRSASRSGSAQRPATCATRRRSAGDERGDVQPDHGLRLRAGRPDHLVRRRPAGARRQSDQPGHAGGLLRLPGDVLRADLGAEHVLQLGHRLPDGRPARVRDARRRPRASAEDPNPVRHARRAGRRSSSAT